MTLIVDAERWCDTPLKTPDQASSVCGHVALALCEVCGSAICEDHEMVCGACGRVLCQRCNHQCTPGRARRAA